MENKDLLKLQKKLKNFFSYFKDDNILAISEDKTTLPFALVIYDEENFPDYFLLSVATDYNNCDVAIEVALWANKIKRSVLSDPFFISQTGNTYTGDEALSQYNLEVELPLDKLKPLTNSLH